MLQLRPAHGLFGLDSPVETSERITEAMTITCILLLRNFKDAALRAQLGGKILTSFNWKNFDMSTERRIARSFCSVCSVALAPFVEITSAAACDPDQETRAHVAVLEREPGYSITALRACPDRYCASFGRRLLIFGMKRAPVRTLALRQKADSRLTARPSCPGSRRASLPGTNLTLCLVVLFAAGS
jgi:hypothetical protein